MAFLYGKEVTRKQVCSRIGDISQIAGAKLYELKSGKAKGVEAVDVKTGSGLEFTILPGRGMDIAWANYREFALAYISNTGVVSSEYFIENGIKGFLNNFFAGLLTTSGLTNIGAPCSDNGEELGLHGVISNIPAEDLSINNNWVGDDFLIKVKGKIHQSRFYGEHIVLTREITTNLNSKKISIYDMIENEGFNKQPFMFLYHTNFGYPIVSEDTELITPNTSVKPRTEEAAKGIESYNKFQPPTPKYLEQCFYHDLETNKDGWTYACLFNPSLGGSGLGIYVKYNKKQLPYLLEWKQMGEQAYVVGLQPGTWYAEGRAEARKRGELEYLDAGKIREFNIEIGVVENKEELRKLLT